ncbi:LOW QUALITY PROTEIN: pre T-cell antigen receptor alpha [Artibeus jamaicensis]|uniref:LOW QUALITY PROTEIN: pre T-cell antigen receptor alpha n=1 Tax=Artibeus jamaicensis TaxID=9417 RepID=UPI00235B1847|nr:LOW QUALITY PROTEIN: pre T-cell antigen receptor alpha [Artibeus jamaicensis]
MARTWLLLLLALGCPALPTDRVSSSSSPEVTSLLRLAQRGVGGTPFPSLPPPITLLVDGKQQVLVVCLVLDVAPPGLESPIWFSAGNGSALDAFTYGPSPAADGTWTSLAQLSLPSEELASWETLVCHTGSGAGDHGQSTQPLLLSGEIPSARTCLWEPLGGTPGEALRLGALRLLLFKLLLFDLLLTCSRLRARTAAPGHPPGETRPLDPGFSAPALGPQPQPLAEPCARTGWSRRSERGIAGEGKPWAGRGVHTRPPGPGPHPSRSPVWEEGALSTHPAWVWCSGPAPRFPASCLGRFVCDLPPPAARSFLGAKPSPPSHRDPSERKGCVSPNRLGAPGGS